MAKTPVLRLVDPSLQVVTVVHWRPVAMLDRTLCGEPAGRLEVTGRLDLPVCSRCVRATGRQP